MKLNPFAKEKEALLSQKGGNLFNKYESKNPILKILMKQFLRSIENFVYGSTILDVGCGEGYVTYHLHKQRPHAEITGIDSSKEIIELAKKLHPGINFEVASAEKIPFPDKSFDTVVASELLEHLPDPSIAIKECSRVSRELVIFSVPREPYFRLANLLRLKYLNRLGNTPGHLNNWNSSKFKELLNKHFDNVKITTPSFWTIAQCHNPKEDCALPSSKGMH